MLGESTADGYTSHHPDRSSPQEGILSCQSALGWHRAEAVVTQSVPLRFAVFDVVSGGKFKGVLDGPNDQRG